MDESAVRLTRTPDLRRPVLFAAWPGMGYVALDAARYLIEKLDMELIGSIESTDFSYAEDVFIQNHIVMPLQIPEYQFHVHQNPEGERDLIVFSADTQARHPQGLMLSRLVLKVAGEFGARRLFTGAALACSISHMETPRVHGVATHMEILPELDVAGVSLLSDGNISGLNGLALGVGRQMGFEGVCLLGELPYYMIGTDNPKSSLAILEKFSLLWDFPLDLSDLREAAQIKEVEIEDFIRQGDKSPAMYEPLASDDETQEIIPQ